MILILLNPLIAALSYPKITGITQSTMKYNYWNRKWQISDIQLVSLLNDPVNAESHQIPPSVIVSQASSDADSEFVSLHAEIIQAPNASKYRNDRPDIRLSEIMQFGDIVSGDVSVSSRMSFADVVSGVDVTSCKCLKYSKCLKSIIIKSYSTIFLI